MLNTLRILNVTRITGRCRNKRHRLSNLLQATLRPVSSVGGATSLPSPIWQTWIIFNTKASLLLESLPYQYHVSFVNHHLTLSVVQDCIASPAIYNQVHTMPSAPRFLVKMICHHEWVLWHVWGILWEENVFLTKPRPNSILLDGNGLFCLPQGKVHLKCKNWEEIKETLCSCLLAQPAFMFRRQSSMHCFYS